MSKSNKKEPRLKDACQRERLHGKKRHRVNQLIKEGRYEELEDLEEEIPLEENE
jgi:hypothetical protein